MKKKIRYIIPIAIIFLMLIAGTAVSLFRSDEKDVISVAFTEGEPHTDTLDFRLYFQTMSGTFDSFIVNIQQEIYTEEAASDAVNTIYRDIKTLKKVIGKSDISLAECVLYIVEDTPKGIQVFGSRMYCTLDDIREGSYLEALAGIVLEADESWKGIGIAQLVREKEPDEQAVVSYLESAEDLDILSLFAAYFHSDFAGEEERETATALAGMLCELVLEEQGADVLLGTSCVEYRQKLLDRLGVGRVYSDSFQGFDAGYTYSGNPWYSFVVTTPRGDEIYVQPLSNDVGTPKEVRCFLYEIGAAPQAILEGIRADAPEYYDMIAENYREPITYYCSTTDSSLSYTVAATREIYLYHTWNASHEIVHIMVPSIDESNMWKSESIAEYLSQKYYPPKYFEEFYFGALREKTEADLWEMDDEEGYKIASWVVASNNVYLSEYGMPADVSEFDLREYYNARVKAFYRNFSEAYPAPSISTVYSTSFLGYVLNPENGNELSYEEAACFADYLVDKYSLGDLLRFCLNPEISFEEFYGMDYDEIKRLWREELVGNAE